MSKIFAKCNADEITSCLLLAFAYDLTIFEIYELGKLLRKQLGAGVYTEFVSKYEVDGFGNEIEVVLITSNKIHKYYEA